jgi:hypothetical protein
MPAASAVAREISWQPGRSIGAASKWQIRYAHDRPAGQFEVGEQRGGEDQKFGGDQTARIELLLLARRILWRAASVATGDLRRTIKRSGRLGWLCLTLACTMTPCGTVSLGNRWRCSIKLNDPPSGRDRLNAFPPRGR